MSLKNSLQEEFSNSQRNYNCCLLTIDINTVAVFKNSEQSFNIFHSHSRDLYGMAHSFERCTLVSIEGPENVASYLTLGNSRSFELPRNNNIWKRDETKHAFHKCTIQNVW